MATSPLCPALCPWLPSVPSCMGSHFPSLAWGRSSLEWRHSGPVEGFSQHQDLWVCPWAMRPVIPSSPLRRALWVPFILDDSSVACTPHFALTLSIDRRPPSPHSHLQPQNPLCLEAVLRWPLLLSDNISTHLFSSKPTWHFIIVSLMKYTFCLAYVRLVLYPEVDCKLLEGYVSLLSLRISS